VLVETGEPGALAATAGGADGTFSLSGIESGARRVQAVGPAGWVLKGIFLDGRDIADLPVEFGEETVTSDVSVVFTSEKTPLTVTLEQAKPGSVVTVFVFPEDASLWHAGSRRTVARVATRDAVVIDQLPPGEYLVAAVADVSPDVLKAEDGTFLAQLRAGAQRVQLADRTPSTIRVRVQAMLK
jgi:hypothetical protein